jgi:hypothetical protein
MIGHVLEHPLSYIKRLQKPHAQDGPAATCLAQVGEFSIFFNVAKAV